MKKGEKIYLGILLIMSGIGIVLSGFQFIMNYHTNSIIDKLIKPLGKEHDSISVIIGGADGPTSIFLAGDVRRGTGIYVCTAILALVTVVSFCIIYKRKKNRKEQE